MFASDLVARVKEAWLKRRKEAPRISEYYTVRSSKEIPTSRFEAQDEDPTWISNELAKLSVEVLIYACSSTFLKDFGSILGK